METDRGGFAPGMTLGTHRLERLLGRGGTNVVFLAYDTRLHRQVALKVLEAENPRDASLLYSIGDEHPEGFTLPASSRFPLPASPM